MSVATAPNSGHTGVSAVIERMRHEPAFAAFTLLRITFTVAPIAFGIDKFFNVLVYWPDYLASWINNIIPGTGQEWMYVVGVVEIIAGLAVALKPRYGAHLVALWLVGIVVNLLTFSGFYDVAVRDFGLLLAALTLGRLATLYDPPGLLLTLGEHAAGSQRAPMDRAVTGTEPAATPHREPARTS